MRLEREAWELWQSGKIVSRNFQQVAADRASSPVALPSAIPRLVMSVLGMMVLTGLGAGAVTFIRQFIRVPLP